MSHVSTTPVKVRITRAWKDLAPKLLAFLTGGSAATVLVSVLHTYFGVEITPELASVIVVVTGTVLGYVVKDTAVVNANTVKGADVAVITALKTPPTN